MATMHAFGHMIEGDLRLERQGNALIVHSKHNAKWFGALGGSFALVFLIIWISMPDQSGLALLAYWLGVVIGVTFVGNGVFLSLPREVVMVLHGPLTGGAPRPGILLLLFRFHLPNLSIS